MRKIEESIFIERPCEEVFTYLENRTNDPSWMASVQESHWLDPGGPATSTGVGRRGRMLMRIQGRPTEFIDEVTEYQPGRVIAHRTVEGPFPLKTACICEPATGGCRATVVGEAERPIGGPFRWLVEPFVARSVRRGFLANLERLKQVMETAPQNGAAR